MLATNLAVKLNWFGDCYTGAFFLKITEAILTSPLSGFSGRSRHAWFPWKSLGRCTYECTQYDHE